MKPRCVHIVNIAIIVLTRESQIIYRSCDIRKRGRNVGIAGVDGPKGDEEGCCYIGDDRAACGAGRQPGSPYCPAHHALCHIPKGSSEAGRARREAEALAKVVGGRQGDRARRPPDGFLKKLERVTRRFSCPKSSCYVPKGER
jgi:hypothetical protein